MNLKGCKILILLLFVSKLLFAQDQTNFTQFFLNPYLLNSSYVGIDGKTNVSFLYRNQWSTIEGAPRIANFSLHTPINPKISTGLSVTNDKRGILNNSSLLLSFGYNILMGEHSHIRFGISAGGNWNTIDLEKIQSVKDDPALSSVLNNNASLNGNAGISFHSKTFHGGLSLPSILAPSYVSTNAFTVTEVKPFQAVVAHVSNRFYFNKNKNIFEPYAIYRINTDLPAQFEVAGILHLNHMVWVGTSFKQDFGISAMGGVKLKNTLAIGASYSLKNSGINELNSPTFEISLGLLVGDHKKDAMVYSFVDTHPEKKKKKTHQSASEAVAQQRLHAEQERKKQQEALAKQHQADLAEKKRADELALKKKQEDQALAKANDAKKLEEQKRQDALAKAKIEEEKKKPLQTQAQPVITKTPEPTKQEPVTTTPVTTVAKTEPKKQEPVTTTPVTTVVKTEPKKQEPVVTTTTPVTKTPVGTVRQDTVAIVHKPRFNQIDTQLESMNVTVTEHSHEDEQERIARLTTHSEDPDEHHESPDAHPNSERHEFVKRGAHEDELDVSDYVVSGVFKAEANAQHFSQGLNKLGFKTHYGHLTEKNLWYVYIFQGNNIEKARAERDRYRKMKIFRDSWLLTVHH
jgi:type IX secretion system PorP/SprF family membrane protein